MKRIITEIKKIKGISILFLYPENIEKAPLIIICHSLGKDKFENLKLSIKLAEKGFCVLTFDMVQHGVYSEGIFKEINSNLNNLHNIFKAVEASYLDLNRIINTFEKNPLVDKDNIILVGFCLGAKLGYYTLSKTSKIKYYVLVNACPNFEEFFLHNYCRNNNININDLNLINTFNYIKKINPYEDIIKNKNRSLLIINGENDEYIPAKISVDLYNRLENKYINDVIPLELIISEDSHISSSETKNKIIDWINYHVRMDSVI